MRYHAHDQARFPLATLLLVARERAPVQRVKLIRLAREVASARGVDLALDPHE